MPQRKKSRKIGKIGISKTEFVQAPKFDNKHKTKKGNKPGTRQALDADNKRSSSNKEQKDPRIGSKQKVDLSKYKVKGKPARYATPMDELNAIENDTKLDKLLSKQADKSLTKQEQVYVDSMLERHKILCEFLGITENEPRKTDPLDDLDAIRLDDFKD